MTVVFKDEKLKKHRGLTDSIKGSLVLNGNTIKETEPHSAYNANLPEGITKTQAADLAKYNSRFVTAAHIAVGEMAAEAFTGDKKLQEVTCSIGFMGANDHLDLSVLREKTYNNYLAGEGDDKEITKSLVIKGTVTSQSVKGYGLKAIREAMSEEFSQNFAK